MRHPARSTAVLLVLFRLTPLILAWSYPTADPARAADDDILLLTSGARAPLADASVSKSVGSGGGALTLGGVTVTVPSGTLDTATMVTLSRTRATHGFGPAKATAHTLDVPDNPCLNQPISAAMRVGGTNRTAFVGLWDAYDDGGANTNAVLPTLVPAQVTDGVLTFSIPATDVCPSASNDPAAIMAARTRSAGPSALPTRSYFSFLVVSGYLSLSSTHFKVNYPSSLIAEYADLPQQILEYAESAYAKLKGMGFSFDSAITWPMAINIVFGMDERNGETAIPLSGKAYQYLNINANKCATTNLDLLKVTVGHEFFHAVQHIYDPRAALRIRHTWSTPVFLWIAEASSTWFEARMKDSSIYVSDLFTNNIDRMKYCLDCTTSREAAQNNGYWASGFLRYLVGTRSDDFLKSVWQQVHDQGSGYSAYSDLTALIRAVGSGAETAMAWQQYLAKVTSGTTGYAGWPLPSTTRSWYSQSTLDEQKFSTTLFPFAGEKWLIGFNSVPTTGTLWFKATTVDADISYDIFRGASADGPFTAVGTLLQDQRKEVTVSQGDVFLISAVNTNTTAPYQTSKTASIVFGNKGECALCADMPANLDVYKNSGTYNWYTQDTGLLVATAALFENGDPYRLWCYDAATGYCKQVKAYFDNHLLWKEMPCDATSRSCVVHGLYKEYFENGSMSSTVTYVHGETIGPVVIYHYSPSNAVGETGNYVSGSKRHGLWLGYDASGRLVSECTYDNGTLVGTCVIHTYD